MRSYLRRRHHATTRSCARSRRSGDEADLTERPRDKEIRSKRLYLTRRPGDQETRLISQGDQAIRSKRLYLTRRPGDQEVRCKHESIFAPDLLISP